MVVFDRFFERAGPSGELNENDDFLNLYNVASIAPPSTTTAGKTCDEFFAMLPSVISVFLLVFVVVCGRWNCYSCFRQNQNCNKRAVVC